MQVCFLNWQNPFNFYKYSNIILGILKLETIKFEFPINLVPNARIELASDPYQGPVLPLN